MRYYYDGEGGTAETGQWDRGGGEERGAVESCCYLIDDLQTFSTLIVHEITFCIYLSI